ARFPTISAICARYGLNLATDLLPIAPAAHYCMGGVMVDTSGRTTLLGLFAVGEVACTGVHGANRLASNSLLEGLVFGLRVADVLSHTVVSIAPSTSKHTIHVPFQEKNDASIDLTSFAYEDTAQVRREVRSIMWQYVSLCRDESGLLEAQKRIAALRQAMLALANGNEAHTADTPYWQETMNMLQVAALVIAAALQRHESRGSHWRRDFEQLDESLTGCHYVLSQAMSTERVAPQSQEIIAYA
ncbi:MAG: FAD-binding protein, partial [Chloroflexota bacterium]|nr:FAD-binding protein [Chloroflexota bacterium]